MVDKKKEETNEVAGEMQAMPAVSETATGEEAAVTEGETAGMDEVPDPLVDAVKKYLPETSAANKEANAITVIAKLGAAQDKLVAAAKRYPAFAEMLWYVSEKGMDPAQAIARTFDRDLLTPPEGAPDWDGINQAVSERDAEIKARDERMNKYKQNGEISLENAARFIEEKQLDEEKGLAFLTYVDGLKADLVDDNISPEHFASLYKGFIYDEKMKEIEGAKADEVALAETRGRNEQITDRMNKADKGDGMPHISSSAGGRPKRKNFAEDFFEGVI